jgi:hypothetical protein
MAHWREVLSSLLGLVSSLRAVARAAGRYRFAVSIAVLRPGVDARGLPRAEARADRGRYAANTAVQRGAHIGGDIDVPRSA